MIFRKNFVKETSIVLFPIFLGIMIYVLYREPTFNAVNWLGLKESLKNISMRDNLIDLPNWVVYNLPDGLWMLAFTYLVLFIFEFKFKRNFIFFTLFMPLTISLISEIGQSFRFIQGTFDPLDILFYIIGYSLPIILNLKKIDII